MPDNLVPDRWYVDLFLCGPEPVRPLNQRFKLLAVQEHTVEVEDEFGERRRVSRIGWEQDMTPLRQPMKPKAG